MAWKRLRPSFLHTVCKSMYIGALISLLSTSILGAIYIMLSYLSYKTVMNCQYQKEKMTSVRMQWARTIADIISCALYYTNWPLSIFLLFRPHQLKGAKRKLILVSFLMYCLDALYRGVLQALGKPFFMQPISYNLPVYVLFLSTVCLQPYLIGKHLFIQAKTKLAWLTCKMATPIVCTIIAAFSIR